MLLVCNFLTCLPYAESFVVACSYHFSGHRFFCHVLFSPMLTFWIFRFEGTESNGLEYQEVFVKSPGGVVVRSHRHKSQSPTPGGGPDEYRR